MDLEIDGTFLAQNYLGGLGGELGPRYHVYRASVHATFVNDLSTSRRLGCARGVDLATREALERQADQGEDLDEVEVIHHLHQQTKSSPLFENAISQSERSDAITTLVATCSAPSRPPLLAKGRPLSSFRRLSFRQSMFEFRFGSCSAKVSNLEKIIPHVPEWRAFLWMPFPPRTIGEIFSKIEDCVVWHVQIDIVDLLSPRTLPTRRSGKRRRTTVDPFHRSLRTPPTRRPRIRRRTTVDPFHQVPAPPELDASPRNPFHQVPAPPELDASPRNPFHQVPAPPELDASPQNPFHQVPAPPELDASPQNPFHQVPAPPEQDASPQNPFHQVPAPLEQDASPRNHPPEAKRFKGVRYRPDRRKWAAEMKPKNSKKVSFGEFKSQEQAARAIDAAFHYYGKPHLLNFPDTPGILSTRPSPAGVPNEKDKQSFVKEQVKWLASIASTLPSSPSLVPLQIPESSSRDCIGETLGFHPFSEIASFLSCEVADESDDGISQPVPSLPPDALAGSASMDPPFVGTDAVGSIIGTVEEHQGMREWSWEDALVAPSSSGRWSPGSSVQITHWWDGAEVSGAPALMNLTNSAEPSCESPGSWMNYLSMFPPASMLPLPPRSLHGDVTHGLLENESLKEENGSEADLQRD